MNHKIHCCNLIVIHQDFVFAWFGYLLVYFIFYLFVYFCHNSTILFIRSTCLKHRTLHFSNINSGVVYLKKLIYCYFVGHMLGVGSTFFVALLVWLVTFCVVLFLSIVISLWLIVESFGAIIFLQRTTNNKHYNA